jgi:hypothetical protein
VHTVAPPLEIAYGWQDRHLLAPATIEYVPFGHGWHTFPPGGEYFPFRHWKQYEAPWTTRISRPPSHLHPAKPVPPGLWELTGQDWHPFAPPSLHMFAGHFRQAGSSR